MLVHDDGYILAGEIEIELPEEVVRRALCVGDTLLCGVVREIEEQLGIRIEEPERARIVAAMKGMRTLRIESSWVRPSRR